VIRSAKPAKTKDPMPVYHAIMICFLVGNMGLVYQFVNRDIMAIISLAAACYVMQIFQPVIINIKKMRMVLISQ
jgi:hypothetical protein